jgi:hypothetical protein
MPHAVTSAYAGTARSLIALITTLNEPVKALEGQVREHFGQHPDAEAYLSWPHPRTPAIVREVQMLAIQSLCSGPAGRGVWPAG